MKTGILVAFVFLMLGAAGCGGGDSGEPAVCGGTVCGERQRCDVKASPPRCVCQEGYAGADCRTCAAGYAMTSPGVCSLQPVSCASGSAACNGHGSCVPGQTIAPDTCLCSPGYAGHACQTCADGYQDYDNNRTCLPSCQLLTMSCSGAQTCTDSSGRAMCGCPGNKTGVNCDQCQPGWVLRPSDNTCVQTCTTIGTRCGTRKVCEESSGMPVCVCEAGHTGTDCSACAAGFIPDGAGGCVRGAPAGTTLLGAGRYNSADYLVAIDGAMGIATPLRTVSNIGTQSLATDLNARVIYALSSSTATGNSTVSRLDPTTGALVSIGTVRSAIGAGFGGGQIYTVGSQSPHLLKRVDPVTAAVADLGATGLVNVQGLAWEAGNTLLAARPPVTADAVGPELFRIDPATGAPMLLGPVMVDANRLRPSDARLGMAFDTGGRLFMVTRLGRAPADIVADHCRKLAAGLGYPGYENAPFTTLEINQNGIGAGMTRVLASKNPSGKEIVAYASQVTTASLKAMLRIETANPETFVCISTYRETLELQIPASTAKFTGVAVSGDRPTLTMTVEGSVPPVTKPTVHFFSSLGSVAADVRQWQFARVYTSPEWTTSMRLPAYASAWGQDLTAPTVLVELDLATRTMKRVLSFPGLDLYPTIAPWKP